MAQPEFNLNLPKSHCYRNPVLHRWSTAIHESGHGVAAVFYGIPFLSITIEPDSAGWMHLDREKIEPVLMNSPSARYVNQLVIQGYAGFIAQLLEEPTADKYGATLDLEENSALLYDHFSYNRIFDKTIGSFRQPTEDEIHKIVNRRAKLLWIVTNRLVRRIFPIIVKVASELVTKGKLSGDEVKAIAGPMIAEQRAIWANRC